MVSLPTRGSPPPLNEESSAERAGRAGTPPCNRLPEHRAKVRLRTGRPLSHSEQDSKTALASILILWQVTVVGLDID